MEVTYSKRDWAFAGLGHPSGVVLARPVAKPRLVPGNKIVLVGDEHAGAFGQFLGKLAFDSKINFRFEWERGQLLERWLTVERMEAISARCPSMLLVSFPTKLVESKDVTSKLELLKKLSKNVALRYILPFSNSLVLKAALASSVIDCFETGQVEVHQSQTGAPSARGYAGLAGAIWGWIK